jgi:hypothetical protein
MRKDAAAAFARSLGGEAPLPSSVITDSNGGIIAVQSGVPKVADIKKMLEELPQ